MRRIGTWLAVVVASGGLLVGGATAAWAEGGTAPAGPGGTVPAPHISTGRLVPGPHLSFGAAPAGPAAVLTAVARVADQVW